MLVLQTVLVSLCAFSHGYVLLILMQLSSLTTSLMRSSRTKWQKQNDTGRKTCIKELGRVP